ncbi:uncharacterized protein LOC134205795 isoform X2 [Armigeres subalbatus]|uniref:uncharacterized protein LOC134205795 isoform X2 n=1 Tax=Armigeres subalbatus TaxID=124917 RepID=UPI002ED0D2EF
MQCRTCRKPPDHQSAVPVEAMLDYHGKSVADMIFELTEIMVTYDHNLPQFICVSCAEDLRSAYNFRQRCIDSNDLFHSELMSATTGGVSSSIGPNLLILKVEKSDPELLEMNQHNATDVDLNVTPVTMPGNGERLSKTISGKTKLKNIVIDYILPKEDRFQCVFDPFSRCTYSQKSIKIGNFIRHCRTMHKQTAALKGLLTEESPTVTPVPTKKPQEQNPAPQAQDANQSTSKLNKIPSMHPSVVSRKYIKMRENGRFYCAIDSQNPCQYSQPKRVISIFMRHFRSAHLKVYASIFNRPFFQMVKSSKIEQEKVPQPTKVYTKPNLDALRLKTRPTLGTDNKERINFTKIVLKYVMSKDDDFYCVIDELSGCRYAQRKLDPGNFLRHFRTQHPHRAVAEKLLSSDGLEPIEKKRVVRAIPTRIDQPQLLEACIKLMAIHNLPVRVFQWPAMRLLLDPLSSAMVFEINETSMVEHIHQAAEHLLSHMRHEMQHKMISIHIECIVYGEKNFLIVSANFTSYEQVHTRVIGLIKTTAAVSAGEIKDKLEQLLNRCHISESQILAIVVGNTESTLQTHKKLKKSFSDSLFEIEPNREYGEPDKEKILIDGIVAELQGQFQVMPNVISTILTALNVIIPNTDPTIERIERFLHVLRSPQYKNHFETGKATYPPLWCSQRWLSNFKSIRRIIKQESLYMSLGEKHPDLALSESDWQFLREYHAAFLPLHKLFKTVERSRTKHVTFSAFYMQLLLVIKDVRALGNRFSKPISDLLSERLMVLKERMVFRAALYLDPRFLYFKSVVLTREQQDDAQNYILNIWNRINALKPNSQTAQFEADKLKQEDKKDDDMDDFLSEMFGGPSEGTSKAVVPLSSTVTPVLQQLKSLEIEPRQPHDYDVWNHWLQRSVSHAELFSVAMVVMSLPSNNVCLERTYSALILADRNDGLTEQTLDELLLVKLNSSLFEKAVVTMYDWKNITRPQETE